MSSLLEILIEGDPTCTFSGCGRKVRAAGLCATHYYQRRNGAELKPIRVKAIPARKQAACSFTGCAREHYAKGWCEPHYQQYKSSKEMTPIRESGAKVCTFPDCGEAARCRGLCQGHYSQWYNGRPLAPIKRHKLPCAFRGCDRLENSRGLCRAHYGQLKSRGWDEDKLTPLRVIGQWVRYANGYVGRSNIGYPENGLPATEFQHRTVMEGILGRRLTEGENVHHINGIRDDNRPENLELWSVKQPPGQRVADRTAWAKEWLAQYEPEALAETLLEKAASIHASVDSRTLAA